MRDKNKNQNPFFFWLNCGNINPLNAELNAILHLLALVGARHIVYVSRIRVKKECEKLNKKNANITNISMLFMKFPLLVFNV